MKQLEEQTTNFLLVVLVGFTIATLWVSVQARNESREALSTTTTTVVEEEESASVEAAIPATTTTTMWVSSADRDSFEELPTVETTPTTIVPTTVPEPYVDPKWLSFPYKQLCRVDNLRSAFYALEEDKERELQRIVGTPADGDFGPKTSKAIQDFCRNYDPEFSEEDDPGAFW